MSFRDWIAETVERFSSDSHTFRTALRVSANELLLGGVRFVGRTLEVGKPIWNREWEVLILLDACRYDLMQEVLAEREDMDPDDLTSVWSSASMSSEFMERNFDPKFSDEMEQTALICANPFTREHAHVHDQFAHADEVWKRGWDDDLGTVAPMPVVEAAVDAWRNRDDDVDRMIVWLMQPHAPYIVDGKRAAITPAYNKDEIGYLYNDAEMGNPHWEQLRTGEISHDEVWTAYKRTLYHVLDSVDVLTRNLDAGNVVISSDHGEGFGEFGVYDHPPYLLLPMLRLVPWLEVDAYDSGELEPTHTSQEGSIDETSVEDKLRSLGYL